MAVEGKVDGGGADLSEGYEGRLCEDRAEAAGERRGEDGLWG